MNKIIKKTASLFFAFVLMLSTLGVFLGTYEVNADTNQYMGTKWHTKSFTFDGVTYNIGDVVETAYEPFTVTENLWVMTFSDTELTFDVTQDPQLNGIVGTWDYVLEGGVVNLVAGEEKYPFPMEGEYMTFEGDGCKWTLEKENTPGPGPEPDPEVPTFSHDTAKEAGNFLSAGLASDRLDLFDRLLTDDEKTLVSGGETAEVWLEAKDATSSVSSDDKAKVEGAMPKGYKLDKYLDLNIFKQIGMNSPTKITDCPGGSVTVSMDVPSELKGKACKIIRVHDGVAEVLDVAVSGDKMSFETDQFSTYALVYEGPVNTGDGMGTTAILFLITGLLSVIALVSQRKKLA